ncbi:MAG: hypothetical protein NTW49_12615 [Bacteroidia bacterium]|nr:hypothetical protein [Bacteroidia bacterium]
MKTKAFLIVFLFFGWGLQAVFSQDFEFGSFLSKEKMEKINSKKISFLTREMNLSVSESEVFWPVYNEYQQKKSKITDQRADILKKEIMDKNDMSDKEAGTLSDQIIDLNMQDAKLSQEYHDKFKKVLSPVKVLKLYQAENKFKLELLKEFRNRKNKEK